VEALEDALGDFGGSVLLVSHDRALLRNLVTRVWALEDGRISDYPGTFEEWEAARAAAADAEARRRAEERAARDDQGRKAARTRTAQEKEGRKEVRVLRRAAEAAEALVHRLESRVAEVTAALADPGLYAGDAAGLQKALALKGDLARLEGELATAMERWMEAEEAVRG
jgi:ATP-binding cassette subfamily F protein 3